MKYIHFLFLALVVISCNEEDDNIVESPFMDTQNFSLNITRTISSDIIILNNYDISLAIDPKSTGKTYTLNIATDATEEIPFLIDNKVYQTGEDITLNALQETITLQPIVKNIGAQELTFTLTSSDQVVREISLPIEIKTPTFDLDLQFTNSSFQTITYPLLSTFRIDMIYDETFVDPYLQFELTKTQGNFTVEYINQENENVIIENGEFSLWENGNLQFLDNFEETPYYLITVRPLENISRELKLTIKATNQYGISVEKEIVINVLAN